MVGKHIFPKVRSSRAKRGIQKQRREATQHLRPAEAPATAGAAKRDGLLA